MGKQDDLLRQCKDVRQKIENLEAKPVDKIQEIIKEIQLQFLKNTLTKIGKELNNLNMYKDNK